ncbi:MAG: FAD-binding protein [Chloroflexi bacterium]|nr:FAD-binding protein [Chloroflexota bacterium]
MTEIQQPQQIKTDVLIIGAGVGGAMAAIHARDLGADVVITTKGAFGKDGAASWMAGSFFNAAINSPDSPEAHVRDVVVAGKYLNNQKLLHSILSHGAEVVHELLEWGSRLRLNDGKPSVGVRLGNSFNRGASHVRGGFLGTELRRVLPAQVRKRGAKILEDFYVTDLLTNGTRVVGALGIDLRSGEFTVINAKATMISTGGYLGCYEHRTGNSSLVGDGHALGLRAGAEVMDMEFVQFMPLAMVWPPVFKGFVLYSMADNIRGHMYNSKGERFMERYYPDQKEFVLREAQSRAIFREVKEGRGSPHGGVWLTINVMPRNLIDLFIKRTERGRIWDKLREEYGIDVHYDGMEVYPACHYTCGGLWIDEKCRTQLEGLYAVGESASGGKDGADRMSGHGLIYAMTMGIVAGRDAAASVANEALPEVDPKQVKRLAEIASEPLVMNGGVKPYEIKAEIRNILSTSAFYGRTEDGLKAGLSRLDVVRKDALPEVYSSAKGRILNGEWVGALEARNMADVARMVLESALLRRESRGLHERDDYPQTDPAWLKHIIMSQTDGDLKIRAEPLEEFPYLQPSEMDAVLG